MEIDVKKVAELSRLELRDEAVPQLKKQMEAIFKYFEEIQAIDTAGVAPLITPSEIETVFRDDQSVVELTAEQALSNAPESSGNLFRVPPVVG